MDQFTVCSSEQECSTDEFQLLAASSRPRHLSLSLSLSLSLFLSPIHLFYNVKRAATFTSTLSATLDLYYFISILTHYDSYDALMIII